MSTKLTKKLIALALITLTISGVRTWINSQNDIFHHRLVIEEYEHINTQQMNENGSEWVSLPFGYIMGIWPTHFHENPIVMNMKYQKGPPEKFIPEMTQIWNPSQAELSIEGPRTLDVSMDVLKWESCLDSHFCFSEKKKFYELTLQDLEQWKVKKWVVTWFENKDIYTPRGVHVRLETQKSEINRYVIFTDKGTTQNFTLTTAHTALGQEAVVLFNQILGGMTVKNDLKEARSLMAAMIKKTNLEKIRSIKDPKERYTQLIQAQNLLFSQLSIDPRSIAPFFHLAGVSHMLGNALIHEKMHLFENQESWIIPVHPLLSSIIQYIKDFPDTGITQDEKAVTIKNVETLLQDYLLSEQHEPKNLK